MRVLPIALAVFSIFGSSSDSFNFVRVQPGHLPPGWTALAARPGESDRWEIRGDSTAPSRPNVIAHIGGVAADTGASLAIFENSVCYDGDLSVKFKIQDAAPGARNAGIIWRYQDPGNFYLLRFSVDQSNIVMFHNGKWSASDGFSRDR